jgi:uncharacterized protein (DUF1778 family)
MELRKNRSELALNSARRRALAARLDQRLFLLEARAYRQFAAVLDKRPAMDAKLRRLLMSKAAWEQ